MSGLWGDFLAQGGAALTLGYAMKPFQGKESYPEGVLWVSPGSASVTLGKEKTQDTNIP